MYSAPSQSIQGKVPQFFMYNFALKKMFRDNRGSIGLTMNNPFNKYINQEQYLRKTTGLRVSASDHSDRLELTSPIISGNLSSAGITRTRRRIITSHLKTISEQAVNMAQGAVRSAQVNHGGHAENGALYALCSTLKSHVSNLSIKLRDFSVPLRVPWLLDFKSNVNGLLNKTITGMLIIAYTFR